MALWSTDGDLRLTYYSSSLEGDEGYTERRTAFVGRTLPGLHKEGMAEEEVQRRQRYYERVLAGETVQYENAFGNDWVQVTLSPLRDASGEIVGLVGMGLDVTEHVEAEASTCENAERRLQYITSQLPLAIWSADTDLRIAYYSSSLRGDERYFTRIATFVGRTLPDIHSDSYPDHEVQRRVENYLPRTRRRNGAV